VINLDERFLAAGTAFIHGPTIAKSLTDCNLAKVLTEDEARRIASNIAKLPNRSVVGDH
jgi:hypothetical protein